MSQDHRTLAEAFVTMINERNADAIKELVAEDYIEHNPMVASGREASHTFWNDFFTAFPDLTATAEDVIVSGDRLVGRYSYRGTHQGTFFGIPATGKEVTMRTINIWRVEGGQLAEHWDEINLYDVLAQVGVVPPFGA